MLEANEGLEKIFENSDIDDFLLFFKELKIFKDQANKQPIIFFLYDVSNKLIKESKKSPINSPLSLHLFLGYH